MQWRHWLWVGLLCAGGWVVPAAADGSFTAFEQPPSDDPIELVPDLGWESLLLEEFSDSLHLPYKPSLDSAPTRGARAESSGLDVLPYAFRWRDQPAFRVDEPTILLLILLGLCLIALARWRRGKTARRSDKRQP